jgi:cytochrome c-type biogenesis protein CcmE
MVTYEYALPKIVTNDQGVMMDGSLLGMASNIRHLHPSC